ncbi:MAG: type II CAAX endopeptidase family protein [Desulfonauticus sp.]|nr:type II CAAX endopeptidase family protein [Desulfonauticus sp.]
MGDVWLNLYGFLAFLIAYVIFLLLAYKIDPRFSLRYKKPPSFYQLMLISTFETTVLLSVLIVLNLLLTRNLIVVFGLDRLFLSGEQFLLGFAAGILLFLAYFPLGILISLFKNKFLPNYKPEREKKVEKLIFASLPKSRKEAFTLLLATSIKAAIFEEIIFRAYLLGGLLLMTPPTVAIIVQALFFFIPHLYQGILNAILPFIGGIIFGLIFYLTGSLTIVILSHFTGDLVGLSIQTLMTKKGKVA